jgi:hypothetical protein
MAALELNLDKFYQEQEFDYINTIEYFILKDFLQPDSTTCLESAAKLLLKLVPALSSSKSLAGWLSRCACVIPWHHTSHLKLAWLTERLRWSPKISPDLADIKVRLLAMLRRNSC